PPALPRGYEADVRGRWPAGAGARSRAAPRLAWTDPLRGDLLSAREAGRGTRHHEPPRVCRHARSEPRGLPEDAQRPGALLGRRARSTAQTVSYSEALQR